MPTPCVSCGKPKRYRNHEGKCTDCAPLVLPLARDELPEKPGPKKP